MAASTEDGETDKPASSKPSSKKSDEKPKSEDTAAGSEGTEAPKSADGAGTSGDEKSNAKPSPAAESSKDTKTAPDKATQASTSAKEGDEAKSDQTVDSIRTEWQKTVASILDNFCKQIKEKTTDSTEQEARFTSSCGGLTKDLEAAIAARRAAMTLDPKASTEAK